MSLRNKIQAMFGLQVEEERRHEQEQKRREEWWKAKREEEQKREAQLELLVREHLLPLLSEVKAVYVKRKDKPKIFVSGRTATLKWAEFYDKKFPHRQGGHSLGLCLNDDMSIAIETIEDFEEKLEGYRQPGGQETVYVYPKIFLRVDNWQSVLEDWIVFVLFKRWTEWAYQEWENPYSGWTKEGGYF